MGVGIVLLVFRIFPIPIFLKNLLHLEIKVKGII